MPKKVFAKKALSLAEQIKRRRVFASAVDAPDEFKQMVLDGYTANQIIFSFSGIMNLTEDEKKTIKEVLSPYSSDSYMNENEAITMAKADLGDI